MNKPETDSTGERPIQRRRSRPHHSINQKRVEKKKKKSKRARAAREEKPNQRSEPISPRLGVLMWKNPRGRKEKKGKALRGKKREKQREKK